MDENISRLIDEFIDNKMEKSKRYLNNLKKLSKSLDYENYLKHCFVHFPEHKWHLDLNEKNINAYKEVYVYVKFNFKQLSQINDFEELILFLSKMNVKHFGELSVYDVSLCIGLMLNILPEKVYLHAGPRNAMKVILGSQYPQKVKTLNKKQIEFIEISDLPKEFNKLADTPYLIEDCLCFIWSQYLKKAIK